MFSKLYQINIEISNVHYAMDLSLFTDLGEKYGSEISNFIHSFLSRRLVEECLEGKYFFEFIDERDMLYYLMILISYFKKIEVEDCIENNEY